MFVIAVVLFALTSNLIRSRVGRGLVAMRDNETGAAVSGVYPAQYKILAFATSALVTSIGGGCFALAVTTIGPDTFGLQRSIEFIAGLVIGGVATILGPAIGGVLVEWLPYWAFEIDWPIRRPTSRVRRPGSSTASCSSSSSSSCRAAIVYGLRLLRSKFMLIVPLLPAPSRSITPRRRTCSRRAGGRRRGDVDADFTFGPGVCPNIHTGPPTRGGNNQ